MTILLTFTLKENLTYSVTNVDALQISILMGYEVWKYANTIDVSKSVETVWVKDDVFYI